MRISRRCRSFLITRATIPIFARRFARLDRMPFTEPIQQRAELGAVKRSAMDRSVAEACCSNFTYQSDSHLSSGGLAQSAVWCNALFLAALRRRRARGR
jgi:hypothetical protein